MTEFLAETQPHFADFTPNGKCGVSFECELVKEICAELGEECVVVPLPTLDARLSSLEMAEVNFSISAISVNPERAERVHFVRPFYYYAGATVFHLNDTPIDEHLSWDDISNTMACINENYYAAPAITFTYNPAFVEVSGNNASNLKSGLCDIAITDNVVAVEGLVQSVETLPEFGAPYGIAVSKEDKDTLGALISNVLINLMDDGPESMILTFEDIHLVQEGGFQPSQKLADLVTAITMKGGLIPPSAEDAIWDE
eukprot:TRINITY_DN21843_c0_g1_i2.p1 TRINITY_DN21843_c0_g1~~TRINITY_DN21843_c0_g1_i2.p1  ORF type:complete len:279 (-),score=26.65 TRINITY_DN21843_c0_g1_i2:421-1188(-)